MKGKETYSADGLTREELLCCSCCQGSEDEDESVEFHFAARVGDFVDVEDLFSFPFFFFFF